MVIAQGTRTDARLTRCSSRSIWRSTDPPKIEAVKRGRKHAVSTVRLNRERISEGRSLWWECFIEEH